MIESAHVDDTLVSYFAPGQLSSSDWARFMDDMRRKPISHLLGASSGTVEVNSLQRKEGSSLIKERNIQVIVITDDRLVRGLVTATAWVGANIGAFSWKDLEAACERLGLADRAKTNEVMSTLHHLRRTAERKLDGIKKAG
jgi:hypothetical protein